VPWLQAPVFSTWIPRLLNFRALLFVDKAEFDHELSMLPSTQITFWTRHALIWLLFVIVVCVSIETIAWVLRGFLAAGEKRHQD